MERLVEDRGRRDGHPTSLELRGGGRRNHVTPEQIPSRRPAATPTDSGDFTTLCTTPSTPRTGRASSSARRRAANAALRGSGIGNYSRAGPPMKERGGIRLRDGRNRHIITALDYGKGHAAPFAQVSRTSSAFPSTDKHAAGRQRRADRRRWHRRAPNP